MDAQHAVRTTPSSVGMQYQAPSAPRPARRACDCCRRRKVKCDGDNPCSPCKKAAITCAYLQVPKKKGPKGLRSQRVLKMLRQIDGQHPPAPSTPISPPSPLRADTTSAFGNWTWNVPDTAHYPPHERDVGPHTDVSRNQLYLDSIATALPQQPLHHQYSSHSSQHRQPPSHSAGWSPSVDSLSVTTDRDLLESIPPPTSDSSHYRLPAECFLPYIQLFFEHMFAIMPVIERTKYLDPSFYSNSSSSLYTPDEYCFLCAICAATSVQLNDSIPQPPSFYPSKRMDAVFAEECLRERCTYDHIEPVTRLGIMTSFFLFAYHGNNEKPTKAWYYLHESITLCENMDMETESAYDHWDPIEAQWRRRLYWLLFITERAYAVQRRKNTRLFANVRLPSVLDSEDPHLLSGFVDLARLFSAVDEDFVKAWLGVRKGSLCDEEWLAKTQRQLDDTALAAFESVSETQRMDIDVTREWLHMLAWQMGVSNGLMKWSGEGSRMNLDYPIELAKKVVEITSSANALALDSHGIGMEQKLYDIGVCLADVLRIQAGDTSVTFFEGREALNSISQKLSSIRGKESRYLQPLLAKMSGLMDYELQTHTISLPTEKSTLMETTLAPRDREHGGHERLALNEHPQHYASSGHRLSIVESMNILRSLSVSGSWGTPGMGTAQPWQQPWNLSLQSQGTQRRESGSVYNEDETGVIIPWILPEGVEQGG